MAGKSKAKESVIDEEFIEEEAVEPKVEAAPVKKAPKKFAPDDRIECRSVTAGTLYMKGPKTQLMYTWEDMDDITYVEYQDLQALQSRKSRFINKPRFIIEDEDIVEEWKADLGKLYASNFGSVTSDLFPNTANSANYSSFLSQLKASERIINKALKDLVEIYK